MDEGKRSGKVIILNKNKKINAEDIASAFILSYRKSI